MNPTTLGQKLTALRRARGLTQEAVAEAIGVTRQTISKWELDSSAPDLVSLTALSDLFDTPADILIRPDLLLPDTAPAASVTLKDTTSEPPPPESPVAPPAADTAPPPPTPTPREPERRPRTGGWILFILGCVCLLGGFIEAILAGSFTFILLSAFLLLPAILLLTLRRHAVSIALLSVALLCLAMVGVLSSVMMIGAVSGIAFTVFAVVGVVMLILSILSRRKRK